MERADSHVQKEREEITLVERLESHPSSRGDQLAPPHAFDIQGLGRRLARDMDAFDAEDGTLMA